MVYSTFEMATLGTWSSLVVSRPNLSLSTIMEPGPSRVNNQRPYTKGDTSIKYIEIDHVSGTFMRRYRVEPATKFATNARMFEEEVKVLRKVEHPNLIKILSHEENVDGWSTVNLQYVGKISLDTVIHESVWAYTMHTIHSACKQLLAAIGALHRNGFIHRDVKPANILVAEDWHLILADLETAKSYIDSMQTHSNNFGSIFYRPPESFALEDAKAEFGMRGDIYSFGVTIGELITRRRCYLELTDQEIYGLANRRKLKFPPIDCRFEFSEVVATSTSHERGFRSSLEAIETTLDKIRDLSAYERIPNHDPGRKEILLPDGMELTVKKRAESLAFDFSIPDAPMTEANFLDTIEDSNLDSHTESDQHEELLQAKNEIENLKVKIAGLSKNQRSESQQCVQEVSMPSNENDDLLASRLRLIQEKENKIYVLQSDINELEARLGDANELVTSLRGNVLTLENRILEMETRGGDESQSTVFNESTQPGSGDQIVNVRHQIQSVNNLEVGLNQAQEILRGFYEERLRSRELNDPKIQNPLRIICVILLILLTLGISRGLVMLLDARLFISDIMIGGVIIYFGRPLIGRLVAGQSFG